MRTTVNASGNGTLTRKHTPQPVRISLLALGVHGGRQPNPKVLGMPTTLPKRIPGRNRRTSAEVASESGLLGATLFLALTFSVLTGVLPAELVLPALSVIVVVCGLLMGAWARLISWNSGLPNDQMMDIAGVLVLIGFATAIVCDKTEALRLLAAL